MVIFLKSLIGARFLFETVAVSLGEEESFLTHNCLRRFNAYKANTKSPKK